MRNPFFEKRRQLREPVAAGRVLAQGQALRPLNWSQNGMLLEGWATPASPGQRLSASVELEAGGSRFRFEAELRVVRAGPTGRLAATYVCLDAPEAARIANHFRPAPGPAFIAEARPVPPPPPRTDDPENGVRLADMVIAQREIASLKTAFARRFHPDTAPRDETYAVRVELFKEFWSVLEAAESKVKGR